MTPQTKTVQHANTITTSVAHCQHEILQMPEMEFVSSPIPFAA